MSQQPDLAREFKSIQAMEIYGGSFASHLAKAWKHADAHHARILRENFAHLLAHYDTFNIDHAENQND